MTRAWTHAAVIVAAALTLSGSIADPAAAVDMVSGRDLGTWRAKGTVRDTAVQRMPVVARAAMLRTEHYADEAGRRIVLTSAIPHLDLRPYAEILAGIRHGKEIQDLTVEVVALDRIGALCGDPRAEACYLAQKPGSSANGHIWIPDAHEDLLHIIVHEYGHHVDNQLLNLSHMGLCSFDTDGSRNWFFEREVTDEILGKVGCNDTVPWEELLGELYAEDFTHLNGNTAWRGDLPVPRPTEVHLEAMGDDIDAPFSPAQQTVTRNLRAGQSRVVSFHARTWTVLKLDLTGPRRADFGLSLRERGQRKPLVRRTGRGSRRAIESVLAPGRYEVGIHATRGSGEAKLRIELN